MHTIIWPIFNLLKILEITLHNGYHKNRRNYARLSAIFMVLRIALVNAGPILNAEKGRCKKLF